ncbi:uncharacterized protein ACO6RY_06306 [Pungitius sinensis]
MLSLEALEGQLLALMRTEVRAALTELGGLLEERSAPAPGSDLKREEDESEVTPTEESRSFNEAVKDQFASIMESWTKGAVQKILAMLTVSIAGDGPAAEQRDGPNGRTKRARLKPKARRAALPKESASGSSRQKKKKLEEGSKQEAKNQNDHIYYREEKHIDEPAADSGSVITPATQESNSYLNKEDCIQEETCSSTATSQITKKKTTEPLKCPSCDKTFALKCMLDRHYLTHTKPHLCSECGKSFSEKQGLVAHSRRHTGEKPYECSDCGIEFAYKYTLARHVRRHSLKKPSGRTCVLCETQFDGALELQRHRCGALKNTFVCSLCPEAFECRESLADHENLHSGDRDFVCEVCGESFFSSSSLTAHRVTHGLQDNCCDVLGLGSSDASVLRSHLSKHSGEKLFACEVCGKGCSHRSALKHHMLTHTGEKPYVCETCGKRCGHASALQNHMRIHTGKKRGQQPVCHVCGKSFRCTVNLKYHMSVHTGVKPYACEQCDKKFSNPSNLNIHMVIHSGEKRYGCNICGRRFTQSVGLKLHRRVHTGEKPYFCVVCGKGFMHCSDFKKHQRGHLPQEPADEESENRAVKN